MGVNFERRFRKKWPQKIDIQSRNVSCICSYIYYTSRRNTCKASYALLLAVCNCI